MVPQVRMNFKLTIIFSLMCLATLGGCKQKSMQELMVGRWKLTKSDFSSSPGFSSGLRQDYYEFNIGRVVEYKKEGTMKWGDQIDWEPYTINPADSGIYYVNDTVWIHSLTKNTLVLKERSNDGILFSTFERLSSKNSN
jgi:hypothetical protein